MIFENLGKLRLSVFAILFSAIFVIGCNFPVLAEEPKTGEVKTSGEGMALRVAPGELLPILVKLMNFGGGKRVDVIINYKILDSHNAAVVSEVETAAVETTASYVKNLQIPNDLPPGKYAAISNVIYEGQEAPATSKFDFTVERKIAGIFISQLIFYGIIAFLIGIVFAVVSRLIMKRRMSRSAPHQYPEIPKPNRIFYEIVSDMIMQMRYYLGEKAVEMAGSIDGLIVDKENGRVLKINKDPSEIVALLLLQYQKRLGGKMGISPRKIDKETKNYLRPVGKHLSVINKYFDNFSL